MADCQQRTVTTDGLSPDASAMRESILGHLPYSPLPGQVLVVEALAEFATGRDPRAVMVLNGYAGTGKTSIMGAFVKAMAAHRKKTVVLAPTGRAAKVAARFAGGLASTIHKRIFRADSLEPDAGYFPAANTDRDTIFIVDEASLITDSPSDPRSLLLALTRHVYSAPGCAMILVGDTAQLPPVGQSDSPAMNPDRLRALGLTPSMMQLDQPVRQAAESGILRNATAVRRMLAAGFAGIPALKVSGFDDVVAISSADLADALSDSWSSVGAEETLIVTRSNKRANKFNQAIRSIVMMAEEPLQRGDRLVIAKNDYYWCKQNKLKQFIANGDTAVVDWVGNTEKMYGRWFSDVELTLPAEGISMSAKIMLRSLNSEGPSLPQSDMERLYQHVLAAQGGDTLTNRIRTAVADPYYNALQAKYAYCVTCHKAQGGQWRHVYIDMGNIDIREAGSDFYRWLYTAMTRATEKVFLVNPTLKIL